MILIPALFNSSLEPSFLGKNYTRENSDLDTDFSYYNFNYPPRHGKSIPASPRTVSGTENVLIICVDFSDMPAEKTTSYFYELVFGNSGSMKSYYEEVSYGQLTISGSVAGSTWVRAPHSHNWYGDEVSEGDDDLNGPAWKIAKDAIRAADPYVDYSSFDSNSNGIIEDGEIHIMVVSAGDPQSQTGVSTDLWPHRWTIWDSSFKCDGVTLGGSGTCGYALVTENTPMGTFAHEFGHDLGLPDLYDTSYSCNGIGRWCLMSTGNHLDSGRTPAHLSAWCKIQLGWINPTVINANILVQTVKNVETNKEVYKLPISSTEYFLIENRQKVGYDSALPGFGILIWHIDDTVGSFSSNNLQHNKEHKRVDLEEADNYGLDQKVDRGSSTDPWYSGNSLMPSGFTYSSSPSSAKYNGENSGWSITNFSESKNFMTISIKGPFTNTIISPGDTPLPMQDGDAYISAYSTRTLDNDTNQADETLEISFTISANKTVSGYVTAKLFNTEGLEFDYASTNKLLISAGVPLSGKIYLSTTERGYYYATLSLLDEQYNMRDEVSLYNIWLEVDLQGGVNEDFSKNSFELRDTNCDGLNDSIYITYQVLGNPSTEVKIKFECRNATNDVVYCVWNNGTLNLSGEISGSFLWTSTKKGNEYYSASLTLYDSAMKLEDVFYVCENGKKYFLLQQPYLDIIYDETYTRDLDGNGQDDTLYLYYELDTNLLCASFITEIKAWNNSGELVAEGDDYFETANAGDENLTRVAWFMCYIEGNYKVSIKVKTYEPDDIVNVSRESTYAQLTPIDRTPKILAYSPQKIGKLNPGLTNFSVTVQDLDTPECELTFVWTLDGILIPINSSKATITIPENGTHSVSVTVSDGENSVAHFWNGTVNMRPIANWVNKPTTGLVGEKINFTASGIDNDGTIMGYFFDFGDGTNSTWSSSHTAEHVYRKVGIYKVRVLVYDDCMFVSNWSEPAIVKIHEVSTDGTSWLVCTLVAIALVIIVIIVIVVVLIFLFVVLKRKKD